MPRRTAPPDDPMLSVEEAATELHQEVKTLYNWRSAGKGPESFKVGRHVFYRRSSIRRFLADCGDTTLTATSR
jgi:predicted DNA-binding transcriptional regulator AlpA